MLLDSCSYVTWSQDVPLGMRVIGHFEPLSQNKFFDPSTPSMRKGRDGEKLLFRGVICCSGRLYAVQGGYMLFRGVICCSGGLYGCSGGLYAVQGGYMRKIMMKIVATIVVASRLPNGDRLQRRPLVPIVK